MNRIVHRDVPEIMPGEESEERDERGRRSHRLVVDQSAGLDSVVSDLIQRGDKGMANLAGWQTDHHRQRDDQEHGSDDLMLRGEGGGVEEAQNRISS